MSKFTNINEAPNVSPADATLIAIKNGKWARCELKEITNKLAKIDEIEQKITAFDTYIKNLEIRLETILKLSENKIQELEKQINTYVKETNDTNQAVLEEMPKIKTSKKSKKSAESAE